LNSYGKQSTNLRDALVVGWQVWRKSLTQGPKIQEFESAVAIKVGAKYAVAVSSATAGLHLALLALELEPKSEVLTSPISFLSSANAALYSGLKPQFVDIDPVSKNLSPQRLHQILSSNSQVSAVIPVHFAGLPCDMKTIHEISSSHGVRIVEDAAHALGASYADGSLVGSCKYSDMTVFSFHPVKSVTTGEGGMITTNNYHLYQILLQLRSHGIVQKDDELQDNILAFTGGVRNPWYHEMQRLGFHYRLTEIQAALGLSQLKKLSKFINSRKAIAKRYDKILSDVPGVTPIQGENRESSAHHLYVIEIDFSKFTISRARLINVLKEFGVGTQVHYRPIPSQPYYKALGYSTNSLPVAMDYYSKCLSIPIYPNLRKRQQRRVVSILKSILSENS
jgi:UDP-4-amino-4,6-dideoxy-N-acetyl-beta-L-altrosamine transaminase